MYEVSPARTATVQYSPRQWVRYLLDPDAWSPTPHLATHVCIQLALSEHYPDDLIPASALPREAAMIAATMRDYQERNY